MKRHHRFFLLATTVLALAATAIPTSAATFTVTTAADQFNTPSGASVSLREAIRDAAANPGADTIDFAPGLSGATLTLTMGQLTVDQDLTIDASALATGFTIDAASGAHRVIVFLAGSHTLTLDSLTLTGGNVTGNGGAIFNGGTNTLTVINSTLSGNTATGNGGAINNNGGILVATGCTFTANDANFGGAILAASGSTTTLNNSTVTDNSSTNNGGGISNPAGTLNLNNVTIVDNMAGGNGGGVINGATANLNVDNTIVAENTASSGPDIFDGGGTITPTGVNIVGDNTGSGLAAVPGLIGTGASPVDPLLAPLGLHGGPTDTRPPMAGSPAIDAAFGGLPTDQRGLARPQNGTPDIGAVENFATTAFTVDTAADQYGLPGGAATSLREAIAFATPGAANTIGFDPSLSGATLTLALGQLTFNKTLTIDASTLAQGFTIDADNASRVLTVQSGHTVTLDTLTLTGGRTANGTNAVAGNPGANATPGGSGGAILNEGTLTVRRCTLHDNATGNGGNGVLESLPNPLNHIVGENGGDGGAISTTGALTIENSTLHDNHTGNGGTSSSYSDGTLATGGVGGNGGAIHSTGTLSITHATITANTCGNGGAGSGGPGADGTGGGVHDATLDTLTNTIIAENTATPASDLSGTVTTASGVNFIGADTGASGLGTLGIDYLTTANDGPIDLAPLADNGGPTETRHPLPGSFAIDGASGGPGTDQRGVARPLGLGPDIGAVETLPVTGTVDIAADQDDIPGPGMTSLREAIAFAAPGATITFAPALSGQTIPLANGQLTIDRDLTIDASALANGLIIDANGNSRVLIISSGNTVTLDSLTITGGRAADAVFGGDGDSGGGIRNLGTLTLNNSTVSANTTGNGGSAVLSATGDGGDGGDGGGIANFSTLTLNNSTVSANSTGNGGFGGVGGFGGDGGSGGGIANFGTLTLNNSTVSANTTGNGGDAGGFGVGGGGGVGGGIANVSTLLITNSTVSANTTGNGGGGGFGGGSGGGIGGGGGAVDLIRSIVAGNTAAGASDNIHGSFNDLGDNLTSGDPLLAPLADNGGPTQTMLPQAGSPAIDAAAGGLSADQRGLPRASGPAHDIGAVELQQILVDTVADETDGIAVNDISLRDAILHNVPGEGELIRFDPGVFPATIPLTFGQLTISRDLAVDASNLTGPVTIDAGGGTARVIDIPAGGRTVTLHSLILTGGNTALRGGGIRNEANTLAVVDSTITGNTANRGGGSYRGS